MEEWEALDVDDSDISSFIRPCKRRHNNHHSPPKTPNTDKTLNNPHSQSPHPIPGPAGAVQAAMIHRRALADRTLSTQEFIHRVDENDGDFHTNAWLSALEFVRRLGLMNGDGDGDCVTPLSSIKKHLNFGIVPHHVLAVIKSCTPNGFGDMMLTLKDPTRTIGATVHRKVFTEEGQFRKDITVGSVLLLHKVAVFCPTSSATYLNITSRNIVKEISTAGNLFPVFSKDSGPPSQQVYPTHSVTPPASGIEIHEKSWMLGSTPSLPQERTEGIMSSLGLVSMFREVAGNDEQNGETLVLTSSPADNGNDSNQKSVLDKENLSLRRDNATPVEVICGGELESEMGDQPNPCKLGEGDNLASSAQGNSSSTNSVHISGGEEKGIQNDLERQRETVNPKGSIPHWTEEQLDELLAFD